MGAIGPSGGGGLRPGQRYGRKALMSEINVTPFVDVMLVLLIVFMITAPLLTVGVAVDLPRTEAKALPQGQSAPLSITVMADGTIFLEDDATTLDELAPRLTAIAGAGYEERIFVRADAGASYGQVMTVLARMQAAGFANAALVTEPLSQAGPASGGDGGTR